MAEQFFAWSQARTFAVWADAETVSHVKDAVVEVVPADQVAPLSQLYWMPQYGAPPVPTFPAVPTKFTGWFVHVDGVAVMLEMEGDSSSQHQQPLLPAAAMVPLIFALLFGSPEPVPSGTHTKDNVWLVPGMVSSGAYQMILPVLGF